MRAVLKNVSLLLMPMALAGCFGGSGGGSGPLVPSPVGFTSFSTMKPSATTRVDGIAQEVNYTYDGSTVTTVSGYQKSGGSIDATVDGDRSITGLKVNGPKTSRTWNAYNSRVGYNGPLIAGVSNDGSDLMVGMLPLNAGYEYQTYGVWQTGRGAGAGTAGAFSVGAQTDGMNVPTSGTATFRGNALGAVVDRDGQDYVAGSDATLSADFASRTVGFRTSNTGIVDPVSGAVSGAPSLDMTGTMAYGGNSNRLIGSASTASGMTGTLDGRFYGPQANEVGGLFTLSDDLGEVYGGSFGAVR